MEEVVYCPVCDSVSAIDKGGQLPICPDCGKRMMRVGLSRQDWEALPKNEKEKRVTELYKKTEAYHLEMISANVASIAGWVRLWSVLSLVGIGIIILQAVFS